MLSLVEEHICPKLSPLSSKAEKIFTHYWCQGSAGVLGEKVTDNERYIKELEVLFSKQTKNYTTAKKDLELF